jgi:uncharacterized protein YjdB
MKSDKSRFRQRKAVSKILALVLAITMTIAMLPETVALADEAGTTVDRSGGNIHDYGKVGDDPDTEIDESAIVADSDVLKSAQYQESSKYELKANGTPITVYKYQKSSNAGSAYYHMDVARFSADDATPVFEVTVKDGTVIDSVEVYPERYYPKESFAISEDGHTLTFRMSDALRYCIVNINGTVDDKDGKPQLAIINDPTETDKPDISAENVLNFKTFSDKYLEEHPITDKVGDPCTEAGSVTDTSLNDDTEYTWDYGVGTYQEYTAKQVCFPNKRVRLPNDVTEAFQAALDVVRESKSLDTIYFPAGTYIWSGLSIKDWDGNGSDGALNIYVDEDALLVNRLQECQEAMEPAIGIWYSSNITISGRGIFDGQGTYNYTWDKADAEKSPHQGGCMVVQSQNITFNDTYLRDAKQWNWECHTGTDVTYNNIKGLSPYQHSWVDGLDLTSGKNITVNSAFTMGNDDTFASGHYNPSNEFPQRRLAGKDFESLTEEDVNIAAAAAVYNKERLSWDTDDSENYSVNNVLGWSPCANSIRLGHNTKWKADGGSYQMKNYTFNNYNSVLVEGYTSNSGGGDGIRVQNGTNGCYPDYKELKFIDCSFAGIGGSNVSAPAGTTAGFNPDTLLISNCWFRDASQKFSIDSVDNVIIEDLHVAGNLVGYTSQIQANFGDHIGKLQFTADGKDVMANRLPEFTYPTEGKIEAYDGNPLIFYVKAEDPDGDEVILGDADVSEIDGAAFDASTGRFSWMPTEEDIGKSYNVTFTASDHTGQPVSMDVSIRVSSAKNSAQVYPAEADVSVQTWKTEKTQNYEGRNYLATSLLDNYGLFGEKFTNSSTGDGTDGKLIFLKFDLTEIAEQAGAYDMAQLALTYIQKRDTKLSGNAETKLRVVEVDDQDMDFGTVTWLTKPEIDTESHIVLESDTFKVGTSYIDQSRFSQTMPVDNSLASADTQKAAINGAVVKTDITEILTQAIEEGRESLILAVSCVSPSKELYFMSLEGSTYFTNATADMAPSILLNLPTDLDIEGPGEMTLYQGYDSAESNSFALKGTGDIQVSLSGDTADGKITWNDATQQIMIREGLVKGIYNITVHASVGEIVREKAFTLTVAEDPVVTVAKQELKAVYDTYSANKADDWTDTSWNAFSVALGKASDILSDDLATKEQIEEVIAALNKAAGELQAKVADNGSTGTGQAGTGGITSNGSEQLPVVDVDPVEAGRVPVTDIVITGISGKIAAGRQVTLKAKVTPSDASEKSLKWTSSNKKVATVKDGIVTVKKNTGGKTVVITAEATDGSGVKASYKITSMAGAVKNISISGAKSVKAGGIVQLKAKVTAGKGANTNLTWTSSNRKYAKVTNSGKVVTTKAGKGKTVKITAMATDGSNKKQTVSIKIK